MSANRWDGRGNLQSPFVSEGSGEPEETARDDSSEDNQRSDETHCGLEDLKAALADDEGMTENMLVPCSKHRLGGELHTFVEVKSIG